MKNVYYSSGGTNKIENDQAMATESDASREAIDQSRLTYQSKKGLLDI